MSTFKKTKVVMLPTNEKADLQKYGRSLRLKNSGYYPHVKEILGYYQHLYFLSDEAIKEGDWVLCMFNEVTEIVKVTTIVNNAFDSQKGFGYGLEYCKKIIATTDKSLRLYESETLASANGFSLKTDDILLPQPSQSFIEKFVEEYNKGNQITEVLVEYERDELVDGYVIELYNLITYDTLKINPKNNTITIRKAKDSWSREEVIELLHKRMEYTFGEDYDKSTTDKWIEENL